MNIIENKTTKFTWLKSIRFKTWFYFFTMAVIILTISLLMQSIFFITYFQKLRKDEIEKTADSFIKDFKNNSVLPNYRAELKKRIGELEASTELSATVFKVDFIIENGKAAVAEGSLINYADSTAMINDEVGVFADEKFFQKLAKEDKFIYTANYGGYAMLIYGTRLTSYNNAAVMSGDGEIYLYIGAPLALTEFMTSSLQKQSYLTLILCVTLSILLSWFISSRLSGPIQKFSGTAKKLAEGDYSVRFYGNDILEIERLADTLNYATEEIGKTEQLRRDLMANVSHDLRTPLTMVKAYAEMIRDISGSDEVKRASHSQVIIDEADRLANLVNDMQNLSKLQSGTEIMEKKAVNLGLLANSVLERFDIYSSKEGYTFIKSIDNNCVLIGDEAKIEQVLYNLIGNAVNYAGEDKVIKIYVKESGGRVYFGVKDNGKGIAPEDIDTVWERYYRTSQAKRTHVGTGIGLSIVKSILISHNAKYGVKSTLGEGSTFWFSMPLKTALESEDKPIETIEKTKKSKLLKSPVCKKPKKDKSEK